MALAKESPSVRKCICAGNARRKTMERSKYGQTTYKAEADAAFPEGCACGNNGGGDCDWCSIYYDGPLYDEEPAEDSPSEEDGPWYDPQDGDYL